MVITPMGTGPLVTNSLHSPRNCSTAMMGGGGGGGGKGGHSRCNVLHSRNATCNDDSTVQLRYMCSKVGAWQQNVYCSTDGLERKKYILY